MRIIQKADYRIILNPNYTALCIKREVQNNTLNEWIRFALYGLRYPAIYIIYRESNTWWRQVTPLNNNIRFSSEQNMHFHKIKQRKKLWIEVVERLISAGSGQRFHC